MGHDIVLIRILKMKVKCSFQEKFGVLPYLSIGDFQKIVGGRTGLVVRASDSESGDPGSILGRVGVLCP